MQSPWRIVLVLLVAACGGGDDEDEGGAGSAAGKTSSESGAGKAAGTGGSATGGKSGGPAANGGGTGAAGKAGAGGKAGAAAVSGGGSGGQSNAAGSSGAAGASGACNLACTQGMHCQLVAVTCIRAPCPAQPMCVADAMNTGVSCDPRKILCKRAVPECPQMQVPSVDGSCYGDCVPVEQCPCSGPAECPDSDHYTCHMSAAHCGPYL